LQKFLEALRVDITNVSRKDLVDLILQNTDEIGMENFFSSFPSTVLKLFLKFCKLKVDSDNSQYTIIRALIEQESIIAAYEPAADEHPSKNKPPIDKNISNVDLYTHYFKEDLAEWLSANGLISNGSKKELVERVRRYLDGKTDVKKDKKKPRKRKSNPDDESSEDKDKDSNEGGSKGKHTSDNSDVQPPKSKQAKTGNNKNTK
jgi:hypothetical protein